MNKRIIVSATFVVIVIIVIVSFASYQANLLEMHDRDRYMANIIASQQSSLINLENGSPPLGSESAPITIVKFGDYQCEACYHWFHNTRSTLIDNYIETGKAKLVFLDLPFLGRDSITAAEASYCAEDQGKYWEYHTMLYTFQEVEAYDSGWADRDRLNAFASSLNMNMDEFNECMDSLKYKDRVKANFDEAMRNGIQSTPTFILISEDDMKMIAGAQPYSVFAATIESML